MLNLNLYIDGEGVEHVFTEQSYEQNEDGLLYEQGLVIPVNDIKSPITLTIVDYPARLREEVKIKIK